MKAAEERDRQKDRDKQRHTQTYQFADTFGLLLVSSSLFIHKFLYSSASYFLAFFVVFMNIEYLSGCDCFVGVQPNGIDAGLHQHTRE